MLKKPCAGTAAWNLTERVASGGRLTYSSTLMHVTSPAEWRNRLRKYLR
jgi:hypothetical protein